MASRFFHRLCVAASRAPLQPLQHHYPRSNAARGRSYYTRLWGALQPASAFASRTLTSKSGTSPPPPPPPPKSDGAKRGSNAVPAAGKRRTKQGAGPHPGGTYSGRSRTDSGVPIDEDGSGRGIVAAYCVRGEVSLRSVTAALRGAAFQAGESDELFRVTKVSTYAADVVHARLTASDGDGARDAPTHDATASGDAFLFRSGAAVLWGLPLSLRGRLLRLLSRAQEGGSGGSGANRATDEAKSGTGELDLPVRVGEFDHEFAFVRQGGLDRAVFRNDEVRVPDDCDDTMLLAVSYGLAQSVRLVAVEDEVDDLVRRTRRLPEELARSGRTRLSHDAVKRLVGELLMARYRLNLVDDILDTPEFFWQFAGLERVHDECVREVGLRERVRIVNARTHVIKDALDVLDHEQTDAASMRVERAILFLIAVEVAMEVAKLTLGTGFSASGG